jgi:hypothetical protein
MKKLNYRAFGTLFTLALAMVALAQEEPPANPPAQEPEEETEAPPKFNRIDVGYSFYRPQGNRHKLNQYARVPNGIFVRDFRFLHPLRGNLPYVDVTARGTIGGDHRESIYAIMDRGKLMIDLDASDFGYFDTTPVVIPMSRDRETEANITYSVNQNINAFAHFSGRRRSQNYEPPREANIDRTRNVVAGLEGNVLGGQASLVIGDHRYYDRTGLQPDQIRHRLNASYGRDFGSTFSVEGIIGWQQIEQRHRPDSEIRHVGLNGSWLLSDRTSLSFFFNRQDRDLPTVENAYVRQRFEGGLRLHQRLSNGYLQLGYRHREVERLRDDHSFVDVPKFDRFDGRASMRLNDTFRLGFRGSWEHASDNALVVGPDARRLWWDDRLRSQIKLDAGTDTFAGYATYDYRFDQNSPRDLEISAHVLTLGGSWILSEKTSGYLEFVNETFEASGVEDETNYRLDAFFPSSLAWTAGLNWNLPGGSTLGAAYTRFWTRNENPLLLRDGNVRASQFTATYSRQISADRAFHLVVAPWSYRDRQETQMGYRSTVVMVSYSTKF